jgi:hypothetical protein
MMVQIPFGLHLQRRDTLGYAMSRDQAQRFISKPSVASGSGSGGWRPARGVSRLPAISAPKQHTFSAVLFDGPSMIL